MELGSTARVGRIADCIHKYVRMLTARDAAVLVSALLWQCNKICGSQGNKVNLESEPELKSWSQGKLSALTNLCPTRKIGESQYLALASGSIFIIIMKL